MVTPKKHLGQHFLIDKNIIEKIIHAFLSENPRHALEIGPGTGVLTQHLSKQENLSFKAVEVDLESIDYLIQNRILEQEHILNHNVLKLDLGHIFKGTSFSIIGNFPYNISSQIMFKVLEAKECIHGVVGMFQKEVADRIASPHGSKNYGILSVLVQAYFEVETLFDVSPNCFNPPPKVLSSVIRLRKKETNYQFQEALFFKLVKLAFGQRRKMLRNSLKSLIIDGKNLENTIFASRPEQLSVDQFVNLSETLTRHG